MASEIEDNDVAKAFWENLSDATALDAGTKTSLRSVLGLGTLATQSGTFSGSSSGTNTGDNAINSLYSGLVTNATHTGDVTGSGALTIANDAVTNAKLANMATATIKGRTTAGTGDPEDLTPAQARTVMELGTAATTNSSDYATAAHTHVSADITDSTPDAVANMVVKRSVDGSASFTGTTGIAVYAESSSGTGIFVGSFTGTGLECVSDSGTYHATFGNTGDNRSFVSRVLGAFGWWRRNGADNADFNGRIQAPANLEADRVWTLPDATGTLALTADLSGYQPLDTQLTSLAGLTYASNTLKVVRVNAGETGFELATISAGGGDALTSNPLSQFAATTSSQLAGVISDETGSGALVFANSPTLVTPALGTPSSGTLTNCTGLPAAAVTGLGTLATQSGTFSGTSSGTNTGDQTSIVGITGTTAQFNTALSDGDFATLAGTETITNKTLTNPTVNNYTEGVVAIGAVVSSHTIAITSGTIQTATLTASTACAFTMPTATAGKSFILYLKQAAATGNGTATFGTTGPTVKWAGGTAPAITATAGKMDILSFVADGSHWYGSIIANYTP